MSFSERISRIYRLNQTTANAAASFLANLGAKVTQTNTITTAVTSGAVNLSLYLEQLLPQLPPNNQQLQLEVMEVMRVHY